MFIISIDTSGKSGGITLAKSDDGFFRMVESAAIAGGTFSAQLVPSLAAMLARHSLQAADLDGFVAVSGPGSFTGLRVGLSAIKGLAEVLKKPIVVVSLLEVLCTHAAQPGVVAAALDAGRNEIFFGLYNVAADRAAMLEEQLLTRRELVERLKMLPQKRIVTCEPAIAEVAVAAGVEVQEVARPGSAEAARVGLPKLLRGETVLVEALDANYLRRSDAEIFFGKEQKITAQDAKGAKQLQGSAERVRLAGPDDLPRIKELTRSAPAAAQWNDAAYDELLASVRGITRLVLVAEENGRVEGFVAGRESAAEWEIENIVVSASERRKGIGLCLLDAFLHHVRSSSGARAVFLEVRASNEAAKRLYEKRAFVEAGRRKQYYSAPLEDALVLKLSMPADVKI